MRDKSTGTVKCYYKLVDETYRVVVAGKYSAGFEDRILLQRRETDEVGDPRWVTEVSCDADEGNLLLRLLANGKRAETVS